MNSVLVTHGDIGIDQWLPRPRIGIFYSIKRLEKPHSYKASLCKSILL